MIFGLIAIGCFVAILFINAHAKDRRNAARAQQAYDAAVLADAVQAGKDQQKIEDELGAMQDMIAQARAKILKQRGTAP